MGRRRSRKKQGDDVVTQSDDPVEPYDICDSEAQSPPRLPGLIKIGKNADHLLDVVSAELLIEAEQRVHLGEPFHLALCGSDAIAKFLERMMYNPDMRRFPWEGTHCWLLDDIESGERFGRLHDTLVPHSGIDETNLHAASATSDAPDFDYVLLDIGADGRVGGVHAAASEDDMQVPLGSINRSKFVAIIGMGCEVQAMLNSLEEATGCDLPVQQVQSQSGTTKWYLSPTTMEEDSRRYEE
jgi:6-phosphogluconolactonase/glucosamine-6-phosphate isomerase/deaminase